MPSDPFILPGGHDHLALRPLKTATTKINNEVDEDRIERQEVRYDTARVDEIKTQKERGKKKRTVRHGLMRFFSPAV